MAKYTNKIEFDNDKEVMKFCASFMANANIMNINIQDYDFFSRKNVLYFTAHTLPVKVLLSKMCYDRNIA